MAGVSSRPKTLDDLRLLVADLSSGREKEELSIGRVPDNGTMGSVQVSGTLALAEKVFKMVRPILQALLGRTTFYSD